MQIRAILCAVAILASPAPRQADRAAGEVLVRVETAVGNIDLAVDVKRAPITAGNFLKYVDGGFYDGGRVHRVTRADNYTPNLPNRPLLEIIQGDINPARAGERFPAIRLERTTVTGLTHVVGTVSMPRGNDADSARSGFFILLNDQPSLDHGGMRFDDGQGAAAFGRVVAGLEVVRSIQQRPAEGQSLAPPVEIRKAYRALTALAASTALAQQRLRPADVEKLPSKPADTRIRYGEDERQFGELRLPKGKGPFPLAVVIHGGCWLSRWTLTNTAPLADALRDAGVATWNIEYRRADDPGGGWPGTFADVADGTDIVSRIARQHPIDVSRVVTIGHSSGAHLALWAAARKKLPKDSPAYRADPLPLRVAIALGGPGDLREIHGRIEKICGSNVIERLMGGSPTAVPDRYAQGSPIELLPFGARQVLIVGAEDGVMPPNARAAYAGAAKRSGDPVEIIEVPGGHFEVIAPVSEAWSTVRDKVLQSVR